MFSSYNQNQYNKRFKLLSCIDFIGLESIMNRYIEKIVPFDFDLIKMTESYGEDVLKEVFNIRFIEDNKELKN